MENAAFPAWEWDGEARCWKLENLVYCSSPKAPTLQCLNLYVPQAYLRPDGSVARDGRCGAFTGATAPVVYENGIGGYSECRPELLSHPRCAGAQYLRAGMVYVSAGARGKQTRDAAGALVGKAPAGLVDLKAGVRFLRRWSSRIPGRTDRIVSVGVSAGGAMSALLGCTGNSENYRGALEEIGACMDQSDAVYAAQCYCPILDLDHADMAYEWMFDGIYEAEGMGPWCPGGPLTPFQQALSKALGRAYIEYFNRLGLQNPETGEALLLGRDGRSGSGYAFLMDVLDRAATTHLRRMAAHALPLSCTPEDYLAGRYTARRRDGRTQPPTVREVPGTDKRSWLSWDGETAHIAGLTQMLRSYLPRLKPCPAFDAMDAAQAENQEFGDEKRDFVHFDPALPGLYAALAGAFPTESARCAQAAAGVEQDAALAERRRLLNPFTYIGTAERADLAPFWRIRVGTHDPHTSFTMAMTLALKLQACSGVRTDYAMVWDEDHGPADYPGECVQWIEAIVG